MLGWPMLGEQIGEDVDDVVRPEPPQRHHRQAFPAVLVDDVEHPELPAVVRLILDKVVGPHMPAVQRAQTDARSEDHTYEIQSLMRISYAVFCLKKKKKKNNKT